MKLRYLLCIGLVAPLLIAAGQPPAKTDQPPKPESMSKTMEDPIFRDALATQEKKMWEDMKSQNWTGFQSALSDQFMSVCPMGIQTKSQCLADIKKAKVNSYNLGDWHAIKLSENAGVVLYRADMDCVTPDGKTEKGTYFCSTTWTKRDGKWVADTHQVTEQEEGHAK